MRTLRVRRQDDKTGGVSCIIILLGLLFPGTVTRRIPGKFPGIFPIIPTDWENLKFPAYSIAAPRISRIPRGTDRFLGVYFVFVTIPPSPWRIGQSVSDRQIDFPVFRIKFCVDHPVIPLPPSTSSLP